MNNYMKILFFEELFSNYRDWTKNCNIYLDFKNNKAFVNLLSGHYPPPHVNQYLFEILVKSTNYKNEKYNIEQQQCVLKITFGSLDHINNFRTAITALYCNEISVHGINIPLVGGDFFDKLNREWQTKNNELYNQQFEKLKKLDEIEKNHQKTYHNILSA